MIEKNTETIHSIQIPHHTNFNKKQFFLDILCAVGYIKRGSVESQNYYRTYYYN